MNKPPVKMARQHQEWLFGFLTPEGGLDPYDFTHYIEEWAAGARQKRDGSKRVIDQDTSAGDLSEIQLAKFKKWLLENRKGEDWVGSGDIMAPAYLYFDEVKKLPAGTWCVHFTRADAFDVFEHGTTLDGLALSTHKREKDTVDCEKNLTDEIGSAEVVYGFAFTADERNVLARGTKYGRNAVLFQTDAGVRAWHIGDEENQVIFPLCSEYNVIPMTDPAPGDIRIQTEGGEEMVFESLQDVITYVEGREKSAVQANPSRRLVRVFDDA